MKGGEGKGKTYSIECAAVWGRGGRGYKAKRVGRRADQAKNKNGQSIEGMRKNMLSVNGILMVSAMVQ